MRLALLMFATLRSVFMRLALVRLAPLRLGSVTEDDVYFLPALHWSTGTEGKRIRRKKGEISF